MTSTTLVPTPSLESQGTALDYLREVRRSFAGSTDVDAILAARALAEILAQEARGKKAADIQAEATETRIRAERRLGELLEVGVSLDNAGLTDARMSGWCEIAAMPMNLFDETVENMIARGCTCTTTTVLRAAAIRSLSIIEPGIANDWSGRFWVQNIDNMRGSRSWSRSPYRSLEDAREDLRHSLGLRKRWTESTTNTKLDDAYARARRLAQALSLVGETLIAGEAKEKIAEAELLQAKVAELLHEGWIAACRDRPLA